LFFISNTHQTIKNKGNKITKPIDANAKSKNRLKK